MQTLQPQQPALVDAVDAFRDFAQRQAAGQVMFPPLLLHPHQRRLYVRQSLLEDNVFRIHNNPDGAQTKFATLADSLFAFFRGSALLYYRDYAGSDAHLPLVFALGDVHPENFGVMPGVDGEPFFGINDFDEAYVAPYTWDVKRGVVGFNIGAREQGYKSKKRLKIMKAFVEGYVEALTDFAKDDDEKTRRYTSVNSPPLIRELIEDSRRARGEWLTQYVDLEKGQFHESEKLTPIPEQRKIFQKAVNEYRQDPDIAALGGNDFFKVKNVAIKHGSGTASLGLERYFVLIAGPIKGPTDDLILEFKQSRRSALFGLVGHELSIANDRAGRIQIAQDVHLVGGDPFYGQTILNGMSFLVRERSPFKNSYDVDDLDADTLRDYAEICGRVLAQSHARSDEDTGIMEGNAEAAILATLTPKVFRADMIRFGEYAADRICADHKGFKKDFAKGAFKFEQP
jgi:uncharacterized protein (DUF2252 family)